MIENCPDSVYKEMTENHDEFYDYQIDALKWLDYKFDYLKYFNKFPEISIRPENKYKNYIVGHLISSSNFEHCLDKEFYIQRLIKDLSKYCAETKLKLYLITTEEYFNFYINICKDFDNVSVFLGEIKEVCDLIINAKGMISTDSGFRFIANSMNIPVLTFTRNCSGPFEPYPSHYIRWLPNKNEVMPLNYPTDFVVDIFKKKMKNRVYNLMPNLQDIKYLIKRDYTVNEGKSILN